MSDTIIQYLAPRTIMIDDQLRYFVEVAKHEHLGRAAESLGLSQPALSRSIRRLEHEFNVRLFERSGRRIRLNATGRVLLRHAESALSALEDGRRELREFKEQSLRTVSIGFLATFGTKLIPDLIRHYKQIDSSIQMRLLQGPYPLLRDRLLAGEIDLCLCSPSFEDPKLDWKPLFTEELVVFVPKGHRLEAHSAISLSELEKEPIVAMKKNYGLRSYLDDLCRLAGFSPIIAYEGEEVATLLGLVGAGFGVTLAPINSSKNSDLLTTLHVLEPKCQREIGVSWRRGRYMSENTARFRQHIIDMLSALT